MSAFFVFWSWNVCVGLLCAFSSFVSKMECVCVCVYAKGMFVCASFSNVENVCVCVGVVGRAAAGVVVEEEESSEDMQVDGGSGKEVPTDEEKEGAEKDMDVAAADKEAPPSEQPQAQPFVLSEYSVANMRAPTYVGSIPGRVDAEGKFSPLDASCLVHIKQVIP